LAALVLLVSHKGGAIFKRSGAGLESRGKQLLGGDIEQTFAERGHSK
jgi:hypothetical protein